MIIVSLKKGWLMNEACLIVNMKRAWPFANTNAWLIVNLKKSIRDV